MKIMINKKAIKEVIKFFMTILVLLVLFFIGLYMVCNFQHTLTTSISPEENNKLVIKYTEPFLVGEHKIKILYGPKVFFLIRKNTLITSLDNEGMAIDNSNSTIVWINDDTAKIQLIGCKHTKTYTFNFITGETHKIQGD